jgi:hypothetical protein
MDAQCCAERQSGSEAADKLIRKQIQQHRKVEANGLTLFAGNFSLPPCQFSQFMRKPCITG